MNFGNGQMSFKTNRGFTFIGLVAAGALILFLLSLVLRAYFHKTTVDKEVEKSIKEQGLDTTSYKSALGSARDKIGEVQKQHNAELNSVK